MDSTQNITQQSSLVIDIKKGGLSYLVYGRDVKPKMAAISFDNGGDLKQALENTVKAFDFHCFHHPLYTSSYVDKEMDRTCPHKTAKEKPRPREQYHEVKEGSFWEKELSPLRRLRNCINCLSATRVSREIHFP